MSQKRKHHGARKKVHPSSTPHRSHRRSRQKWTTWVVVFLMLAAMLMYVLSDDESMPPQDLSAPEDSMGTPRRAVPAD